MWAGAGGPRPWGWPIQQAAFANVPHEHGMHNPVTRRYRSVKPVKIYVKVTVRRFMY